MKKYFKPIVTKRKAQMTSIICSSSVTPNYGGNPNDARVKQINVGTPAFDF